MTWDFIAKTAQELAEIGEALLKARNQKDLDEQVQMTRLLEAVAMTSILKFPVRVRHTGSSEVPDFQLESDAVQIAAELAKIAVQDVEHAHALQHKEVNRPLSISSLYRKQTKPRTKSEVIAESLLPQTLLYPVSIDEHSQRWHDEAAAQLQEKTTVLKSNRFRHGDQNWLVLWDRIGIADWQVKTRLRSFRGLLVPFWRPNWYSVVFLQEKRFRWLAIFTSKRHDLVPASQANLVECSAKNAISYESQQGRLSREVVIKK